MNIWENRKCIRYHKDKLAKALIGRHMPTFFNLQETHSTVVPFQMTYYDNQKKNIQQGWWKLFFAVFWVLGFFRGKIKTMDYYCTINKDEYSM